MLTTAKTLLLFSAICCSCLGQNHFMTAVRNLNDSKNETKDGDNALKNGFIKYMKECASDEDASEQDDSRDEKQNKGRGNGGTYPEFYGDRKLRNNRQRDNSNQHRNYTRNDQRKNEGFNNGFERERTGEQNIDWRNRNPENPSYSYDNRPIETQYAYDRSVNNGNFGDFRDRMGNPTYPNNRPINGYVRTSNDEFYGSPPRQYGNIDDVYRRMKRSEDANCINQCAFGYLDVLDDNRVPSETAMIKYLQDHVPNDRKRIQYLRETRRCFAQLATTDNGDGCGFSKMLTKCLKLETE